MIKKSLKYISPLVLAGFTMLLSPLAVFGVANVTLSTVDIRIDTPGTTLKIEGPVIDTIVVNSTSTVITMNANGDAVTISNTDRYRFTVSGITDPGTNCGSGSSSLVIPSQSTNVAVTVTPSTICASDGGGGGVSVAPAPAPAPAVTPSTATGNVTATSAMGGNTTASTSDGSTAKVDVPAAAISVDTTFTVAPTAKTASTVATQVAAVPSGQQVVGANIYNYSATAAGASVTSFASAVTLTLTYTDAQVAGLALSSLKVHKYNEATGAWVALATTVNTTTKTITATTSSFSYFAIFGSAEAGETPVTTTPTAVALVDINGNAVVDGDLITTATSFDIYIVKLKNDKKFKRLILNPEIFNSYGHLSWDNVKTVSQAVQDAYTASTLVIEVNPDGSVFDPKVYSVTSDLDADVGTKHWVNMTAAQFEASGRDWDSIYHINHTEASPDFYPLGADITA